MPRALANNVENRLGEGSCITISESEQFDPNLARIFAQAFPFRRV